MLCCRPLPIIELNKYSLTGRPIKTQGFVYAQLSELGFSLSIEAELQTLELISGSQLDLIFVSRDLTHDLNKMGYL